MPCLVPSLRVTGLVMAVIVLGAACGRESSPVRSDGQSPPVATAPPSSAGGTLPDQTTTTTIGRPATSAPATTVRTPAGSGVKGTVVFGPVCPVERLPPDPQCAPRPGAADIQLVRLDGTVAGQARAGADGAFTVVAVPGSYTVKASAAAPGPGRGCQAEPAQVTVANGSFISVVVTCDTGIR